MVISFLSCFLILCLQVIIFFFLLNTPLSLWFDATLTSGIISAVFLGVQVLFSGSIYDLFFLVDMEKMIMDQKKIEEGIVEKDEEENAGEKNAIPCDGPKELENDSNKHEQLKNRIQHFFENLKQNVNIIIFRESHPLILSYSGLMGGKRLVVSTGLAKILKPEELDIMVKREAQLLQKPDITIFSIASFLPFLILTVSNWMVETAKELRKHRGTGASYLAGAILFYVYRISEFFLLFISRARQKAADEMIKGDEREIYANALEKTARSFNKPIIEGPAFRKLIYETLRYFFPFDPYRVRDVLLWEKFLKGKFNLWHLMGLLEKKNSFFKRSRLFSSHTPPETQEQKDEIPLPFDEKYLKRDIMLSYIPISLFTAGVIFSVIMRGYFGVPLILLGLGLAFLIVARMRNAKKCKDNMLKHSCRVEIEGKIRERYFDKEVEAPYYFLDVDGTLIPIILRQLLRNESPLYYLLSEKVKINGVIKTEEIPYIDTGFIIEENRGNKKLMSFHQWFQALAAVGIMGIGTLMLIVQMAAMK